MYYTWKIASQNMTEQRKRDYSQYCVGEHMNNPQNGCGKLGSQVYAGQFVDCSNPNFAHNI